ncbi:hypothetical protein Tco_0788018 [Tanacetum coccineum]
MKESKTISVTFPNNVKLSSKMGPISEEERIEIGSSERYMANPDRGHWEVVKRSWDRLMVENQPHGMKSMLDVKTVVSCGYVNNKSRICCSYPSDHRSSMVEDVGRDRE